MTARETETLKEIQRLTTELRRPMPEVERAREQSRHIRRVLRESRRSSDEAVKQLKRAGLL